MNHFQDWKNWLLTLPESVFFSLTRNYLGQLPTPFNKHRIFEELNGLLNQPKVQNLLAASLDELDHRILTIIALLDKTPDTSIRNLLTDLGSPWMLYQRLINLQERLILYKNLENIYRLTPPLEGKFRSQVIRIEEFFPSFRRRGEIDEPGWSWDGLLLAFRSFLLHSPPTLKIDGTMGKRDRKDWKSRFPHFAQHPEEGKLFLETTAAEGLWAVGPEGWTLKEGPWEQLKALSTKDRALRLCSRAITTTSSPSCQWNLKEGMFLIESLWETLDPQRIYPVETLTRVLKIILAKRRLSQKEMTLPLKTLKILGVLVEEGGGNFALNRRMLPFPPSEAGGTLHPNYELTLPPAPDFAAALSPLRAFELIRYDLTGQYCLSQESYGRSQRGGKKTSSTALLEKWIGRTLPQNISFSLNQWDGQLRDVRLLEGLVLKVSKERIPLIEQNPLFPPHILETLAPGVYLMDPRRKNEWEEALLKTGITTLPPVEQTRTTIREEGRLEPAFPSPRGIALPIHPAQSPEEYPPPDRESLFARLKELKLSEEEAEELSNRIRRGIILFPEQLSPEIARGEIRTVKGLDYQAKVQLIQETLASGQAYLEISWFSRGDQPLTKEIIPRRLFKEEAKLYLTGALLSDSRKEDFRIEVRKISRVKRHKLSFFTL